MSTESPQTAERATLSLWSTSGGLADTGLHPGSWTDGTRVPWIACLEWSILCVLDQEAFLGREQYHDRLRISREVEEFFFGFLLGLILCHGILPCVVPATMRER